MCSKTQHVSIRLAAFSLSVSYWNSFLSQDRQAKFTQSNSRSSQSHVHIHRQNSLTMSLYLWRLLPLCYIPVHTGIITEHLKCVSECLDQLQAFQTHSAEKVSNCRVLTSRQQKEAKSRQRDSPSTHHLQQGSSDKLPDSKTHDGWSSRAKWCPQCAIYCNLTEFICLHASFSKSLSI